MSPKTVTQPTKSLIQTIFLFISIFVYLVEEVIFLLFFNHTILASICKKKKERKKEKRN